MYDYEPTSGYMVVPRSVEKLPEDISLIFRYLLFKATYKERESRNLDIGQVDTTIEQLVKNVKGVRLTEKQMRNRIKKMIKSGMISYQPGRPNVPSIITVLNYAEMRDISNYGNPKVTRREPEGNPKGTRQDNRINNLTGQREPEGKQEVTRREPEGQPIERIKNKYIKHKEEEESNDSTTLRGKLISVYKKLSGSIANNRRFQSTKKDLSILDELQREYSTEDIDTYWKRFCTAPSLFYADKPITFPLFKAAIADDYAVVEFDWHDLAKKFETKRRVR
jgi:hypothetical protein